MADFPTAAVDRLGDYNGARFDAQTNPFGMAIGGHRVNFTPSLNDTALVVNYVGDAAEEIAAFAQQTAADRVQTGQDRAAAAASAAAAAMFNPARFSRNLDAFNDGGAPLDSDFNALADPGPVPRLMRGTSAASNAPELNTYFYVQNFAYSTNRTQLAIPYLATGECWIRHRITNEWSAWRRLNRFPTPAEIGVYTQAQSDARYPRLDGANAGPLGAFRNKLINTHQHINLRGYASNTATTAANQYTIDRWRVVVSGQRLAWVMDAAGVPTYTAPAGGVEQVVEAVNIENGTYVLSWTGTATATVNGAAVANGGQVALNGQANATVRFSGGTFSLPQLERGTIATVPERRPIQIEQILCARYAQLFDVSATGSYPQGNQGAQAGGTTMFPVQMRATPTIISGTVVTASNISNGTITAAPNARSVLYLITQGAQVGNFAGNIRDNRAEAEL